MISITSLHGTQYTTSRPSTSTPIVFVVDDDESVRDSLELLIEAAGWRAETFASAQEFLTRPRSSVPSCVIVDVTLSDRNGLELQKRVAADRPDMPIIFISEHCDVRLSVQAMKAGAVEFLTKPFSDDVMSQAIEHALERSRLALEREAKVLALRESYESLTPREKQVYERVISGKLNKQIAYELSTTERTIKAHRHNVMAKLQARSVLELVWMSERVTTLNSPESVV